LRAAFPSISTSTGDHLPRVQSAVVSYQYTEEGKIGYEAKQKGLIETFFDNDDTLLQPDRSQLQADGVVRYRESMQNLFSGFILGLPDERGALSMAANHCTQQSNR